MHFCAVPTSNFISCDVIKLNLVNNDYLANKFRPLVST